MENSHIVSGYDKNLDRIKSAILDMGDLVISQLRQATEALADFDEEAVSALIATDRTINGMNKDIYMRAETLIARRQPMALDLRQALAPINIAGELERIGDHAKSTAKRARLLSAQPASPEMLETIERMSGLVQDMLSEVLRAYEASDKDLALEVRAKDKDVDQINKDAFADAVALIKKTPASAETHVHLIVLARGFERIGDHVVNIARYVHQIVTGEDLKAANQIN